MLDVDLNKIDPIQTLYLSKAIYKPMAFKYFPVTYKITSIITVFFLG
jgi:hypothetical protein